MYTAYFIYLLEVSVCMIILYGFYHMVLKNENFFQTNRLYLLTSIGLSFLIPAIHYQIIKESVVTTTSNLGVSNVGVSTNAVDLSSVLLLFYCAGAVFITIKFFYHLNYIVKLIRKAEVKDYQGFKIAVIDSRLPVFSFLNYIFWSKELDYDDNESEQILKHEQVHINQYHSLDLMFLELINIVLWFNPIVYLYKRNLKNIHEYIVDQDLFEKQNYQYRYLDLLVNESKKQQELKLPVVHTFYNSQLKKRLIMIKNNDRRSNKLRVCWSLPFLAALVFCFSIDTVVVAQRAISEESVAPKVRVDTIITFNPETLEESVKYVTFHEDPVAPVSPAPPVAPVAPIEPPMPGRIDTIITFDPKTLKESIRIIKYDDE